MAQIDTPAGQNKTSSSLVLYASLLLFLITGAAYGGLVFVNASQKRAQTDLADQIRLKEEDLRPQVLDQIFAFDKRLTTGGAILNGHALSGNIFPFLENVTHPRVRFRSFRYTTEDKKITLAAETADYGTLAQQISFLQSDPNIDTVEFGGLSNSPDSKNIAFKLIISLVPALFQPYITP